MPSLTRRTAAVVCGTLILSGCASRLDRAEIIAAQQGVPPAALSAAAPAGAALPSAPGSGTTPAISATDGSALGVSEPAAVPGNTAGTAGAKATPPPAAPGVRPAPGAAAAAKPNGLPLTVGFVGSITGLYGTVFRPVLDGIQIHVADINARGGINGHPIRLVVADDGADPATYVAHLRRLVEQEKVIAFVGNTDGATLSKAAIAYVESKKVPILDGDNTNTLVGTSPMVFPYGAGGLALNGAEFGAAAEVVGKGAKIGYLSCQEVQQCADYAQTFAGFAARAGLTPVYGGRSSVTAPDFTASCLQARNAGVEVLFLRFDTNSVKRIARDCSRQGFKPRYVMAGGLADTTFLENPALEGAILPSQVFPFIDTTTTAGKDFRAAMLRTRPAAEIVAANAHGWAVVSIFAKAAEAIAPDATPDTDQVLKGLYTFKDERLGGQTQPITYTPGKPPAFAGRSCYFLMVIASSAWSAPQGTKVSCLPD